MIEPRAFPLAWRLPVVRLALGAVVFGCDAAHRQRSAGASSGRIDSRHA